jgi:hypothetical protein
LALLAGTKKPDSGNNEKSRHKFGGFFISTSFLFRQPPVQPKLKAHRYKPDQFEPPE